MSGAGRVRGVLLTCCVAALPGRTVGAAPSERGGAALTLEWRAPTTCPESDALRERVAALVRADATPLPAEASVVITPATDEFRAELRVRTSAGETARTLTAIDCGALVDAVAVIIAYAVDPVRVQPLEEAPSPASTIPIPPAPPPAATPSAPRTATTSPATAPTQRRARLEPVPSVSVSSERPLAPRRLAGALRLGPGLGAGPLPSPGPVFVALAGLRVRGARVDLVGAYWLSRPGEAASDPRALGRFSLWTLGVRGGYGFTLARALELPLTLGIEGGALRGAGEGLTVSRVDLEPWVALTAAVGLSWEFVRGFGLWLEVGGALPLRRPGFAVQQLGGDAGLVEVHRAAAIAGTVTAGLEVRLGPRARRRGRRG